MEKTKKRTAEFKPTSERYTALGRPRIETKRIYQLKMFGKRKIESMTPTEAEVLAMLIDTEGCIHAAKRGDYHVPEVNVGMSAKIPYDICEKWGGSICEVKRAKPHYKRF